MDIGNFGKFKAINQKFREIFGPNKSTPIFQFHFNSFHFIEKGKALRYILLIYVNFKCQ